MRVSIRAKLLISILLTTAIIYGVLISFLTIRMRNSTEQDAKKYIDALVEKYAREASVYLSNDMTVARTLAHAMQGYKYIEGKRRKAIYEEMMRNIFIENPEFISVWVSFEYAAIDDNHRKPYGRERTIIHKDNNEIKPPKVDPLNMRGDDEQSSYYKLKINPHEAVLDPYYDSYSDYEDDTILMASCAVPIMDNGKFVGLAGNDIPLKRYQDISKSIKPFDNSYAFICANNGVFVAHPDIDFINKSIEKKFVGDNVKYNLSENIRNGIAASYVRYDDTYVSYAPIKIGRSTTPWSLFIVVPMDVIMKDADYNFFISLLFAISGFLVMTTIIWIVAQYISKPLVKISEIMHEIALGSVEDLTQMTVKSRDEIGQIRRSVNVLIEGLQRYASFAKEIEKGNLETEFKTLSVSDNLGNALGEMRRSLLNAKRQQEERQTREAKQSWTTTGLAKFGDILREYVDNQKEFAYAIISNIVKYLEADQGGLFLKNDINERDIHLQLAAHYAYGLEKMEKKRIEIGENLVGISFLQGEIIHMDNVPENYINTSSGLGSHPPRNLLIVPLRYNEEVFGVFELASFSKFEDYHVDFIEKVGESTASTLSNIKLNLKTAKLLEESRKKSEELAEKEALMKRNMDEMQKTQIEVAKREAEKSGVLNALNAISYVAEYDMNGKIIQINDLYLDLIKMQRKNVIGKYQGFLSAKVNRHSDLYRDFWEELRNGVSKKEIQNMKTSDGRVLKLLEAYTPILDNEGKPFKVLNISLDITEREKQKTDATKKLGKLGNNTNDNQGGAKLGEDYEAFLEDMNKADLNQDIDIEIISVPTQDDKKKESKSKDSKKTKKTKTKTEETKNNKSEKETDKQEEKKVEKTATNQSENEKDNKPEKSESNQDDVKDNTEPKPETSEKEKISKKQKPSTTKQEEKTDKQNPKEKK